jgi:hypothetical protein
LMKSEVPAKPESFQTCTKQPSGLGIVRVQLCDWRDPHPADRPTRANARMERSVRELDIPATFAALMPSPTAHLVPS